MSRKAQKKGEGVDLPGVRAVYDALVESAAHQYPGVTGGVYGIESLQKDFAPLGPGLPVITIEGERRGLERAPTDAAFAERLFAAAPYFRGFDLKLHGLVLAGGAAAALLMHQSKPYKYYTDYDFFLVGHESDEAARSAIRGLGDHLHGQWEGRVEVYRTQGCVSFYGHPAEGAPPAPVVQVILRRYSTLAEVVHGFDLGSSAVAYDGGRVYLTALGKLAADHGVNVLSLEKRRPSYERRLERYAYRGYDIVLPDLDVDAFRELGGCLPYLTAYTKQPGRAAPTPVAKSEVVAFGVGATRPGCDMYGAPLQPADAAAGGDVASPIPGAELSCCYSAGETPYGRPVEMFKKNIRALAADPPRVSSLCGSADYVPGLDIAGVAVRLDPAIAASAIGEALRRGKAKLLPALVGIERAAELMVDHYLRKEVDPEKVREAWEAHAAELRARPELSIPFVFMRVEDRTNLIAPYPREVVSKADWYGGAYAPAE